MRIVLMGPPGAGKGTHAKRLAERFDLDHLSSGDIFRAERASGSDLGRQLARYMDAGELVPDDIVVGIMTKAITSSTAGGGILLDGFPRTVAQAKALDEQLAAAEAPLDAVIVLSASDPVIIERITGRRSCPTCGRVYHVKFMPPADDTRCDDCGTQLVQRPDDTEDLVKQRLEAYRAETEPVVEYYRSHGRAKMIQADGEGSADEVYERLAESLRSLGAVGQEG